MLEIKDRCTNCLHSKVCSKKEFYADAQETLGRVDFSVGYKDILISINCPYYHGTYSSVMAITFPASNIDDYKYNCRTNTTSDARTAYDYAETKEN